MIAIKVNGGFLDLEPNTSISFEFNNTGLALGEDIEVIPTSFSLPITIPLSDNNVQLTGYPNLIESAADLMRDEPCEIHFGNYLFSGFLTITNAYRKSARAYILVNPSSKLQEVNLRDIDYGGDIDISDPSPVAHAKATTTAPLDQGYIFFPVYAPKYFEGSENDPGTATSKFNNYWDIATEAFVSASDQQNAMPFIRIAHLIEKLYAHIGFPVIDNWMTTDELKKLCLYNNYSIYNNAGGWDSTINLANHVPNMASNEFLRKLFALFGVGVFHNPFDGTTELRAMRDVITAAPRWDWTSKAGAEFDKQPSDKGFKTYCHVADDADPLFELFNTDPWGVTDGTVDSLLDLPTGPGVYYVIDQNAWYFVNGALINLFAKKFYKKDSGYPGDEILENELAPLFMTPFVDFAGDPWPSGNHWQLPTTEMPGFHPQYSDVQHDYTTPRLVWYRNIELESGGQDFPYANNGAFDFTGNQDYANSLLWNETNNLYDTWLKELNSLMNTGKIVVRSLNLSITDFLNFRLQDKVRIAGQNYLVKRLRVTFRGSRMITEATLITTV